MAIGVATLGGFAQASAAQESPVIAIDIALEPDVTMIQHAQAANARLLKAFPQGFALDETHQPHVTMLQHSSAPPTSIRSMRLRMRFWPRKSRQAGR